MVDTSARDPRAYELMAIFIPDLSDEEVGEELDRVSGYITSQGASITNINTDAPWGRRRIAYTIRFNSVDYRDGIYTVIHFESVPSVIAEIERELKLDTRVMRYLLVLNDPPAEEEGEENADEAEAEAPAATEAAVATDTAAASTDEAVVTDEAAATTEEAAVETETASAATDEPAAVEAPAETEITEVAAPVADASAADSEDTTKEN